jgi:hypothetical protein
MGGKPGDPRLEQYSERHFRHSDYHVMKCKRKVEDLHILGAACKSASEAALLFSGFQQDMFQNELGDPRQVAEAKRDAAYDATEVLLASIVRMKLLTDAFHPTDDRSNSDSDFDDESNDGNGRDRDVLSQPAQVSDKQVLSKVARFMLLDHDPTNAQSAATGRNLTKQISQRAAFQEVGKLSEGIKCHIELGHNGLNKPEELLLMFLNGQQPCASEQPLKCLRFAYGVSLCDEHRCHLWTQEDARCKNALHPRKQFLCATHVCDVSNCEFPRTDVREGGSTELFCEHHACFKCIQLGCSPACLAEDEPPRNVCGNHPICWQTGCLELCAKSVGFCLEHKITRCTYVNHRGKQCPAPAVDRESRACLHHVEHFLEQRKKQEPGEEQTLQLQDADAEDDALALQAALQNRHKSGKHKRRSSKKDRESKHKRHRHEPKQGLHIMLL